MTKQEQKRSFEFKQNKSRTIQKGEKDQNLDRANESSTEQQFKVNINCSSLNEVLSQSVKRIKIRILIPKQPKVPQVVNSLIPKARNGQVPRIIYRQLRLTQMGIVTGGKQRPFNTICAECQKELSSHQSKINGRGPCCHLKHLRRTQTK